MAFEEKVNNLTTLVEETQKKLQKILDEQFEGLLTEFFESSSLIESVRWRQYTPYFNDGDECVFSIYEMYAKISGMDELGGDYEDGYYAAYDLSKTHPKEAELLVLLGNAAHTLKDLFKIRFGDHVEVTIKRDGEVIMDEYSHD